MTTKAYHQWHHRKVAHRKFEKVQAKTGKRATRSDED